MRRMRRYGRISPDRKGAGLSISLSMKKRLSWMTITMWMG
jgi:hypothetical protein